MFVKPATTVEAVVYTPTNTFADFVVHEKLAANVASKGYTAPSPIQDQAIPLALEGRDLVGIANTGTGKTAAFAIPVANKLIQNPGQRALVVAPTRELAQQIQEECRSLIMGSRVYTALITGGSPIWPQVKALERGPQFVIGTPGRIKDHIDRGNINLSSFNTVVLDEVDRMLDMGFINEITDLLNQLPKQRQSLFFSATMEPKVASLIEGFSNDAVTISVKTGDTSDNVDQNVVTYTSSVVKIEKLHDILNHEQTEKTIIFDETKRNVERLSQELASRGFSVESLHGDKSQGQRKRALDKFRKSEVTILVATDVAARGIDVADITHVINYSTPQTYDDYVHRIGRAGRAGKTGTALTFITA
jgi:superfamily II DNA/RNA helicase